MNAAAPRSLGARAAGLALLVSWLSLLGGLGAGIGYVLFLPEQPAQPLGPRAVALALPDAPVDESPQVAQSEAPAAPPEVEKEAPPPPTVEAPDPAGSGAAADITETEPAPATEATAQAEAEAAPEAPKAPAPPAPSTTQEAALPQVTAPAILPPWQRNALPFDAADTRPRIAIVVSGLGMSSAATEAAIKQLPGPISLSFTPYSRRLNEWIALARVSGHEVLLDLPMEPTSYPEDDPGPQALLTALSERQNLERLDWALRRTTGIVGVTAVMGSRFLSSEAHMTPILNELKTRGLLFLDSRASETSVAGPLAQQIGLANAVNDRFLDRAQVSRVAIDARLTQLERIARTEGFAVAIGQPYPATIERLRAWAAEVQTRGFVLAPLSTVAADRVARQTASRDSDTQ